MSKEVKEWFKVIEIAELLGLSKVSIYNKIKALDNDVLQPLQRKEKGITYFNLKAVDIIRAAFTQDNDIAVDADEVAPEETEDINGGNEYIGLYISELKSEIEFLKEQIKNKDDLINKHVKLVENEQVLRREEQRAAALLEEARIKEIDNKISEWRKEHFKEPAQEEGFFKRLFRKKV